MTKVHKDVSLLGVGIDVSKARLDLAFSDARPAFDVDNDPSGHAKIVHALKEAGPSHIVIEATGGYERLIVAELSAPGGMKEERKNFAYQGLRVPGNHRAPSGRSRKKTLVAHVS